MVTDGQETLFLTCKKSFIKKSFLGINGLSSLHVVYNDIFKTEIETISK